MMLNKFLYPQICTLKSKFRKQFVLRGDGGRDIIFLCFFIALEIATFIGTRWVLRTINQNPTLIFLQPAQPLSLFLACLLVMTFFAALVAAYDAYYQAYDLELILASPVNQASLFIGRFLSVFVSVSWMPFLLLAPVLAAFGDVYRGGTSYYFFAVLMFVPYFFIPSALGIVTATLFARFIPSSRSREFLFAIAIGFIVLLYRGFDVLYQLWASQGGENRLSIVIQILTKGEVLWLPSYWTARAIEGLLVPQASLGTLYLMLSICSAMALSSFGYLLFTYFHGAAFNITRSRQPSATSSITRIVRRIAELAPIKSDTLRALLRKEAILFSREITQIIQLLMMTSLVLLYLINLRAFIASGNDTGEVGIWYQRFTFIGNFSVGAFISIAACTRLVFPSLSLEGRSLWILQTAPVSFSNILRVKFWYWFFPIATLSLTLFAVSALAVGMSFLVALCYGISSLCIAYGVVGSACGLGAAYARFDWESPSQLCAGFGSLMYMLYSSFLVTLTMIPTWFFLFKSSSTLLSGSPTTDDILNLALNSCLVFLINFLGTRLALGTGERALERMRAEA